MGAWLTRDRIYTVTDSIDPEFSETYTVFGPPLLSPDWGPMGPSSYSGGMGIPAAWSAALMRAYQLARFPFHLYRDRAGVDERLPTPPFLLQPNRPFLRIETFSSLGLDYIWHGNAIARRFNNADGTPAQILPVRAELCTVGRHPRTGRIQYDIGDDRVYDQDEILHVRGPHAPGELRGLGVLEAHFAGVNGSKDLQRQVNNHVHGVPTGVIEATSPDTGPAELTSAKSSWLKAQRTRTIAALASGTKFTPISWNPEQMQLVEVQKFDLVKLALIFRLPAYWLNGESSGFTYSSADWEGRNLLKYTAVGSDLEHFEQALSTLYPNGTYVKGNPDAVLRGSTRERYEAHEIGIRAGFLQKSEAREIEDLPPVPGIDDPAAPAQPPADPSSAIQADPSEEPQ
jgi:HK97 family phage portal protein